MNLDLSFFIGDLNTFADWARLIGALIAIIIGMINILTRFLPWLRTKLDRRSMNKRLGADFYTKDDIMRAIRYYVEPFCQSLDPAGGEEPKLIIAPKAKLFSQIDELLYNPSQYRYIILLADSGMGKTAFMLNYYARHLRRWRKKFDLVLMPLGMPDVDQKITEITNKNNKILFLDALDEDTLAIVDHKERVRNLIDLTRDFKKVLITCRTQFFPKDEEIPTETGVVKIGIIEAGEKAEHLFHKLYLSPFTESQIKTWLRKRFPLWLCLQRRQAKQLVDQIPHLSVRPMLLTHIKDLLKSGRKYTYCFEIYEEMVEAWLIREEGRVAGLKKEPLRQFSELVALDLYLNRKQRKGERISKDELVPLAQKHRIPVEDWHMTGRSLLNRDAVGNYKFAHRSIMEYLFVKRFMEMDAHTRPRVDFTDQMCHFVMEMIESYQYTHQRLPDLTHIDLKKVITITRKPLLQLRATGETLSDEEVKQMLAKFGFFDITRNQIGKGCFHLYEFKKEDAVIIDYTTGLMWQQGGSSKTMNLKDAQKWIRDLNRQRFAGCNDWRLPTLEEAMNLMEPKKKNASLYIDPLFDRTQSWIWTADRVKGASWSWVVNFYGGDCYYHYYYGYFVRAVRAGQS
ncbi:DUF1566 domain-containing protein, partial [candidate division KSB1 bacterium]|nr:DUF1566 domain-containing protein [candidate division KSB1 bacterium]